MIRKVRHVPVYLNHRIRDLLDDSLLFAHGARQAWVRRWLSSALYQIHQLHSLITDPEEHHLYVLRGAAQPGAATLSVGLAGIWQFGILNNIRYYQHILFDDGQSEVEDLGSFPINQLKARSLELAERTDLVIVHTHHLRMFTPPAGRWAASPEKVRSVMDFEPGETWEDIAAGMRQDENLRRIRKAGFTSCLTRSLSAFDLFYNRMYVPLVSRRHSDYGSIDQYENLRRVFHQHGAIMQILDSSRQPVSAAQVYLRHGVFTGIVNGVLDGRTDLIKKGAQAALYYFGIQYAFENGFRRFDAGRSDPFKDDGVYRHKQSWGLNPSLDDWAPNDVLFWVPNGSAAALDWLDAHPLIPEFASSGAGSDGLIRRAVPGAHPYAHAQSQRPKG